jgi:hypothetical protein
MAAYFWLFAFIGDAPDQEAGGLGTPPPRPPTARPVADDARDKKCTVAPQLLAQADADGEQVKIRVSPMITDEMAARAYVTYPPCSQWYRRCANAVLIHVGD